MISSRTSTKIVLIGILQKGSPTNVPRIIISIPTGTIKIVGTRRKLQIELSASYSHHAAGPEGSANVVRPTMLQISSLTNQSQRARIEACIPCTYTHGIFFLVLECVFYFKVYTTATLKNVFDTENSTQM